MPAEWESHARTWMAWPCRLEPWGSLEGMLRARLGHAAVARAISGFEKVTMAVHPRDVDEARLMMGRGIEIFEAPIDNSWARDSGPIFVSDGRDGVAGVHWRFNAWGNKYHGFDEDAAFGQRVIEALDMRRYEGPMVLEGGSICVDGEGTLHHHRAMFAQSEPKPEFGPAADRGAVRALLRRHEGDLAG